MTALPNHTCYKVLESYGIELPFEVITIEIVEFDRNLEGFKKRYGTHAVLINGKYDSLQVKLANISGSWAEIACSKMAAYEKVQTMNAAAEKIEILLTAISENKNPEKLGKNIAEYNRLNNLFLRYGVSPRRKIEWIIRGNTWQFVKEGENVYKMEQ